MLLFAVSLHSLEAGSYIHLEALTKGTIAVELRACCQRRGFPARGAALNE